MLTIAWDVDDVLNNLMQEWFCKLWLPAHPGCSLAFEKIVENPPHKLLGTSKQEYLKSLDEFRLSKQFQEIKPVPETKDWFLKYGDNFRHIVVTAVPMRQSHLNAGWVLSNFGRWIRTLHFIPSLRKGEKIIQYDRNKTDFLHWFGKVDIFIDDNEQNILRSQELGIKGILFPRPWNSSKLTVKQTLEKLTRISKL